MIVYNYGTFTKVQDFQENYINSILLEYIIMQSIVYYFFTANYFHYILKRLWSDQTVINCQMYTIRNKNEFAILRL